MINNTANTPIDLALAENADATARFVAAARAVPQSAWSVPIKQASWTPAQLMEHIVLTTEAAAGAVRGDGFGKIPFVMPLFRPLLRSWYHGVLKRSAFPEQSKGPAVLRPSDTPPSFDASLARLEASTRAADAVMREYAAKGDGTFKHPVFGTLAVTDYARFGALHSAHHAEQLERMSAMA